LEHDAVAVALQAALSTRVILIRTIGEGGMGRVYLGRDPQLKRFVAVKVLLQSHHTDAEAHARFQREAQAIAAVSHPNVVAIYGVGELPNGLPYFIMQYIAGGSMAERLAASGPLPVDVAESVIGDVAAALGAAHRRGLVHRDVKPANVLWDEEAERATVSDFGIVALQSDNEEPDMRITGSGMAVGSPAYMSPEQLLTEPITPKSDIYALGLLGYELLTGRGPYDAKNPHEVVAAHLRDKPRRLSEVRGDIPEALQELLLRCLAKQPADRPTADEVMLALTPGAADPLEWPPPGLERARGVMWRMWFTPLMGALLLLLPLMIIVYFERPPRTDAGAWAMLMVVSSLVGFAALARGAMTAARVATTIERAARLSYGWGTLAEVLSDRRGDTGSLIAGTREYASLSPPDRARLRVLRVVRALLFVFAAPAAILSAIVALVLRGGEAGGDRLLARAVVIALALFMGAGVLAGLYERALLSAIRRRRAERPRRTNERELAPAWYAAFERSREGQPFGQGAPVRRMVPLAAVAVGAIVVLFFATLLLTMSLFTLYGQFSAPTQSSMALQVIADAKRIGGARSFRSSPDSTTALEAGDALLSVASTWRRRSPSPIERRTSVDYPRWEPPVPPDELFPRPHEMPWTAAAVLAAGTGLTPAQRAMLERAAAHPARDEFSRAAGARSADVYGALLKLPLKERLDVWTYPFVALIGASGAAESHAALVALDVADKRPLDAERHAREIISVGALMLDLHSIANNRTAVEILDRGASTLKAVYVVAGRERDARELLDSVITAPVREWRPRPRSGAVTLTQTMRDPSLPRGVRMEAFDELLSRACADPRQVLFGVNDAHRRLVSYARDSVARYPSERLYVDASEATITGDFPPPEEFHGGAPMFMARLLDVVVGGRRFENCVMRSELTWR
jgi:serine/threonine-protein kinase